jgi:hypothetical protein
MTTAGNGERGAVHPAPRSLSRSGSLFPVPYCWYVANQLATSNPTGFIS